MVSAADLIALHADYRVASPRVASAVIEKTLAQALSCHVEDLLEL